MDSTAFRLAPDLLSRAGRLPDHSETTIHSALVGEPDKIRKFSRG
jgi:hypothetical protein